MPITPLPQFEADLAELEAERERAEKILRTTPSTVVVKYGVMRMIGEFPYDGSVRPGCGSKLVCRTHRGTELTELLTSTCPNAGCGSSVTRKEMLEYIEASGGRDYPFSTDGRALRVATGEDLELQARLDASKPAMLAAARDLAASMGLPMKIVEAEPLLGGERVTFYYTSEERIDFRGLVQELRPIAGARVELRQVGARDEARLTADYERCGQYCCCKTFLKVLKPVSMKSAKVQKATLDPLKISGRCGRLMCCLRYEDQTYDDLKKNLPKRKARVGTPEGNGVVVETQILTQLALVSLDADGRRIAVPVEELTEPGPERPIAPERAPQPSAEGQGDGRAGGRTRGRGGARDGRPGVAPAEGRAAVGEGRGPSRAERAGAPPQRDPQAGATPAEGAADDAPGTRKRRRRRRRPAGEAGDRAGPGGARTSGPEAGGLDPTDATPDAPPQGGPGDGDAGSAPRGSSERPEGASARRRRRRRRRPGGGGDGGGDQAGGAGGGSDG